MSAGIASNRYGIYENVVFFRHVRRKVSRTLNIRKNRVIIRIVGQALSLKKSDNDLRGKKDGKNS